MNEFNNAYLLLMGALGGAIVAFFGKLTSSVKAYFWSRLSNSLEYTGNTYTVVSNYLLERNLIRNFSYGRISMQQERVEDIPERYLKSKKKYNRNTGWIGELLRIERKLCYLTITETIHQGGLQDRRIKIWSTKKNIRFLKSFFEELLDEVFVDTNEFVEVMTTPNGFSVSNFNRRYKRPMSTIYHAEGKQWEILEAIRKWETKRDFHEKYGLNYHMGVLLYGPPGTGKTSFALALASELNRKLIVMDMSQVSHITDLGHFKECVILWDECDALLGVDPSAEDNNTIVKKSQAMASLMTTLDGPTSPHNVINIFTTNHRDSLPSYFLRPGRVDLQVEFSEPPPVDWLESLETNGTA